MPRQRYFDGEVWTEHYHDEPAAMPGAPMAAAGGYAPGYAAAQPALSPIEYWKKVMFENYANFSGRARRAEFWWAYLINIAIIIVVAVISIGVLGDAGVVLYVLVVLATVIPQIAALVRRLHDTGKSGWYYFIALIPLVGGIIVIVALATDSVRGPNQYGPSPKY